MWQLALVSLLWALSFGLVAQLKGLDPAFVAALRTLLAALVFLPFLRARGLGARRALGLMAVGGLQFGLMYVAYIQSYRWLGPAEVALFTIFTPLYVALLGRATTGREWLGVAASLAGIFVAGLKGRERLPT